MSRRRTVPGSQYSTLQNDSGGDDSVDNIERSEFNPVKLEESESETIDSLRPKSTPWLTILLALSLFLGGCVCLVCSVLFWMGLIADRSGERMISTLVLGFIMFIPGSWATWIIFCTVLRIPGYSFDDIPTFNQ